jgi:hypothetical protein
MPSFERTVNNAPTMAQELSNGTLAAICISSTVILALIVALIILLFRARTNHKRLLADLEGRGFDFKHSMTVNNALTNVPRHVLRRSSFLPFGAQTEWNTLHSQEDLSTIPTRSNRPAQGTESKIQKSTNDTPIVWPFQRHASIQMELLLNDIDNKRLSAIIESPAIMQSFARATQNTQWIPASKSNAVHEGQSSQTCPQLARFCSSPLALDSEAKIFDSLKPPPLIISKRKRKKRDRAQTIGPTIRPVLPSSEGVEPLARRNLHSHTRSFSLGSHNPGIAPHDPAPPLPHDASLVNIPGRPKNWVEPNRSRSSVSSIESIGSSLLTASPRITRPKTAWLKYESGPKHEYTNSLITGPRLLQGNSSLGETSLSSPEHTLQSLRGSIRSNPDYMSIESGEETSLPQGGSNLLVADANSLSPVNRIETAETDQLNRISAASSPGKQNSLQILNTTPRRQSRFMVKPNGSPAQRKASVLCDVSGIHRGPNRHASQPSSRASSTRSSNGNPFQWDPSPMASGKPSAMKGSPNSRNRGHRRQNCVRIQLSPQILGVPGKSPSPTMAGIQEESPETVSKEATGPTGLGLTTYQSLPRPPSTSTFAPDLKLLPTTLRASLTPSSPTLPLVQFGGDFPSQEPSISSFKSSPMPKKDNRRQSTTSIFTIPSFPSPGKTVLTTNVMPTPTFSFSRPSHEFEEQRPPPAEFKRLARPVAPDSPPADIMIETNDRPESSTLREHDFSLLSSFNVDSSNKNKQDSEQLYPDPVSTPRPLFAPHSWTAPPAYNQTLQPISPPCSPKSMSTWLDPSTISPENLPVSKDDDVQATVDPITMIPDRSPSPIPSHVSVLPQRSPTTLHGPRDPPGKTVSSFIRGLRRLNSDAKNNRYFHFGRQVSPALDQSLFRFESCSSIGLAIGYSSHRGSFASLSEIDHALDDNVGKLSMMEDDDVGVEAPVMEIPRERDREDVGILSENGTEGQRIKISRIIPAEKSTKRESTVWDDSERFWVQQQRFDQAMDSSLPLTTTTNSQNKNEGGQMAIPRRVSQMRKPSVSVKGAVSAPVGEILTPLVKILPPSSDIGTPVSLYDENGFLKN